MGKKIVYSMTPDRTSKSLTHAELAFAGFFSAVPTTFVAAPVERVKVLLQVCSSQPCLAGDELTGARECRCKDRAESSSTTVPSMPCASSTRRVGSAPSSVEPARPLLVMDPVALRVYFPPSCGRKD